MPLKDKIEKMGKIIPHFSHLIQKCKICLEKMRKKNIEFNDENNFIIHFKSCFNSFNYKKKKKAIAINGIIYDDFYNLCCCQNIADVSHDKNIIFKTDFSEEKNNNLIKFRVAEMGREIKYIPNYEKMELLVGLNKSVFEIIQSFDKEKLNLNIYGDNMKYLKTVGSIIKEYYQERYNFYETYKKEFELYIQNKEHIELIKKLKKIQSAPDLAENQSFDDIQNNSAQSTLTICHINKPKKIEIVEIELNNENQKIFAEDYKNNINNIYFIYVYNEDLAKNMQSKNNKIFWFILNENLNPKDKKYENEIIIESIQEPNFDQNTIIGLPNQYIKYQNKQNIVQKWRHIKF